MAKSLITPMLISCFLSASIAHADDPNAEIGAANRPTVENALESGERATRDAAIIIGNEHYNNLSQATYASRDSAAFYNYLLTTRGTSGWRTIHLQDATLSTMARKLNDASKRVRNGGTLWVYFSGHGTINDAGERGLLSIDADPLSQADESLLLKDITALVERRNLERVVVILDAGFGNFTREGVEIVPGKQDPPPLVDTTEALPQMSIWMADQGTGPAVADPNSQHGLFTWLTLGSLRGWADGTADGLTDDMVTFGEAQIYVAEAARALGHDTAPSIDTRLDVQGWNISQGDWLEDRPGDELLAQLSITDRMARFDTQHQLLLDQASADWQALMEEAGTTAPSDDALNTFLEEYSTVSTTVRWAVSIPQARLARQMLIVKKRQADLEERAAATDITMCEDLVKLEALALNGEISTGLVLCLENRMTLEPLLTTRNKISRLLLVNAEAGGDMEGWSQLMARHLEEIDRSDPDLCFRFAIFLYKKRDLAEMEESIRWADYALENKQRWSGDEFVKKVFSLYKLRAEAAMKIWQGAEQRYRSEATPENEDHTADARGAAKDYAREWLDYARASESETQRAFDMCVAAAGTQDFCRAN